MNQRKQTRKMSFSAQADRGMRISAERMTKENTLRKEAVEFNERVYAEEERKKGDR